LTSIDLSHNLLIQNEAVDSILEIICKKDIEVCVNNVESLCFENTQIKREGFIKLVSKINKETIKELDMSNHREI